MGSHVVSIRDDWHVTLRAARRQQVLYLNPGSAGPRRFKLPVSVAILSINGRRLSARIVELKV